MATYSNFFSSGLLAPSQFADINMSYRAHTPNPPSSPMIIPSSPIDRDTTPTPTQMSLSTSPAMLSPLTTTEGERPRLRKHRSSLSVNASPMGNIKSPARNAGNALTRTGIMSPSRSRAGSVGMGVASEMTSLAGRMRSGSLGVPMRPRRMIRKASAPAPTAPLPALPNQPTFQLQVQGPPSPLPPSTFPSSSNPSSNPFSLNFNVVAPNPRRPLTHRFHSYENQFSHTMRSAQTFEGSTPDFTSKLMGEMGTSRSASPVRETGFGLGGLGAPFQLGGVDEDMKEN